MVTSEVRGEVVALLRRFGELVSARDPDVLTQFATDDDVLLIGSEAGEVARGSQEVESFFERVFARDGTFSWEWDRIDVSHSGDLAWFFAEGRVVLSTPAEERRGAYRITGVAQRHGGRWLWRQYHGSEPADRS